MFNLCKFLLLSSQYSVGKYWQCSLLSIIVYVVSVVLTEMNKKLVVQSNSQEFHAQIFFLSLKFCGMIMEMKAVRQHLQKALKSKWICFYQ